MRKANIREGKGRKERQWEPGKKSKQDKWKKKENTGGKKREKITRNDKSKYQRRKGKESKLMGARKEVIRGEMAEKVKLMRMHETKQEKVKLK